MQSGRRNIRLKGKHLQPFYEQMVNSNSNTKSMALIFVYSKLIFKTPRYEQAFQVFEKILKKNRNDFLALPQLVIAAAHFDPSLVEKYLHFSGFSLTFFSLDII